MSRHLINDRHFRCQPIQSDRQHEMQRVQRNCEVSTIPLQTSSSLYRLTWKFESIQTAAASSEESLNITLGRKMLNIGENGSFRLKVLNKYFAHGLYPLNSRVTLKVIQSIFKLAL